MAWRILALGIILFSVLFLPWWVSVLLAVAGMIYFSVFWEVILVLFLSDLIYGAGEAKFGNFLFVYLLGGVLLLLIIETLKKKMRFYND